MRFMFLPILARPAARAIQPAISASPPNRREKSQHADAGQRQTIKRAGKKKQNAGQEQQSRQLGPWMWRHPRAASAAKPIARA